jgi:hypothetical protein
VLLDHQRAPPPRNAIWRAASASASARVAIVVTRSLVCRGAPARLQHRVGGDLPEGFRHEPLSIDWIDGGHGTTCTRLISTLLLRQPMLSLLPTPRRPHAGAGTIVCGDIDLLVDLDQIRPRPPRSTPRACRSSHSGAPTVARTCF